MAYPPLVADHAGCGPRAGSIRSQLFTSCSIVASFGSGRSGMTGLIRQSLRKWRTRAGGTAAGALAGVDTNSNVASRRPGDDATRTIAPGVVVVWTITCASPLKSFRAEALSG